MSFPRYPAYKDSGVEWLGEVPEHWEEKPLKTVTSINDEVLSESVSIDHEIEYVDISSVSLANGIERTESVIFGDAPSRARRIPRDGDVLVSTVRTYLKAIAPVVSPPCNLVASTGFAVVRPQRGIHPGYLKYALQEEHFIQQVISRSTGVSYPAINASDIARIPLSLPKQSEQLAIATFLDRETAKIDALITEQQRLIELLQEKRQAVISHAVTKGLNPDAPMKDSGVEWLGEVPEHWEVCRVKAVSVFTTSGPRGWSERVGDVGALFVQSGDLTDVMGIDFANCKRVQVGDDAEAARTKLLDGDLVVCITGAKTGNVAVCENVPESSYVNQHLCLIRPDEGVHPRFLGALLKSGCGQTYFSLAQYGLKQGLSLEDVREAPVALPPLDEQDRICQWLSGVSSHYLPLEAESQSTISLLQERRSALISAAVTGQIDVRGLVPEASDA